MTDNKERAAFEAWLKERPYANFADYAWDGWQARAALAASQEKAEPVALGFRIELRGACHVVVWHDDSCRPASDEEIALWNRAAAIEVIARLHGEQQ